MKNKISIPGSKNTFCNFPIAEKFEDTKWVIRIRKSKDRQHNGQKKNPWWRDAANKEATEPMVPLG
jgi:hypothetical protein